MEWKGEGTYTLSLQVSPSQAVVMLIEIHHLEAIELCRYISDLLFFPGLSLLNALGVPLDVFGHGGCGQRDGFHYTGTRHTVAVDDGMKEQNEGEDVLCEC